MSKPEYPFKYAERCLYDYPLNREKLERLAERLTELRSSSTMRSRGYEPVDRSSGSGDPVAVRTFSIMSLEEEIARLTVRTKPITRLMYVLDAPFALEGTPLESLAKVARMHYFAKMPKAEIAARLGVTRQTVYNMRVRLVELVIKYMELRIKCQKGFDTLNGNPCYTCTGE